MRACACVFVSISLAMCERLSAALEMNCWLGDGDTVSAWLKLQPQPRMAFVLRHKRFAARNATTADADTTPSRQQKRPAPTRNPVSIRRPRRRRTAIQHNTRAVAEPQPDVHRQPRQQNWNPNSPQPSQSPTTALLASLPASAAKITNYTKFLYSFKNFVLL